VGFTVSAETDHAAGKRVGVTISQVAEAAGVSRATVSRVMNGHATVAPELAARVRATALALGYEPNPHARSLALGRTTTVALVVPDLSNPMFQAVFRGLSQAAAGCGHRVIVAESNEDAEDEALLAVEVARRCDGLVLASSRLPDDQLAAIAPSLGPLVLVNRELPQLGVPSLTVDYGAGARDVATHLLSLGHTRLAYLAGPSASVAHQARSHSLQALLGGRGDVELLELPCGPTFVDGHACAQAVISSGATGVIAFNDLVAFGVVSGLIELGVPVPDRISVAGFDDIPFARYTAPPLTTASVPQHELGSHAWERLWALLRGLPPQHNIVFRPRLEIRRSTGPAPR
jgi:LacI family transcriptional regulator, galactose operon repressor